MSKNSTVLINLVLLTSFGLAACSKAPQKNSSNKLSSTLAAQYASEGKTQEASDMYARIGEILLSKPEGIIHSETMFQKSLELDANNDRANLYSALVAPVLTTKGFINRFKILNQQDPAEQTRLDQLEIKIRESGVKEFMDFAFILPKGKKAAKNMEDVRQFYRNEYAKELGKSIAKLDNIKSENVAIDLDINAYKNRKDLSYTSCESSIENGEYNCSTNIISNGGNDRLRHNVDVYDLKALKIIFKTQKNAFTIAYSVGLEGFEAAAEQISKLNNKTDKEIVKAINAQPNLFKIDGTKDDLREIFNHTEEVMNDLIDFSKISKELCSVDKRKTNLINSICVSEEAAEKINETLMYVVGPKALILGHDKNDQEVSVEVNLRGLLDSKVKSLQELLPNKFDAFGKALDLKDPTFAGIIPNGDLISKLKMVVRQ